MDIQTMIYIGLLAALMAETIIIGRAYRKLVVLGDLVASSPAVCFVCCKEKGKYIHRMTAVPDHIHPEYHEYIDARLVYIPDELLR